MGDRSLQSLYLVRIENRLPPETQPDDAARLARAEAERAEQLAAAGLLVRLWRVAGRRANVGLWAAGSVDILHDALASLPMYPYLDISVVPLAEHPNDPGPTKREAVQ